MFKKGTRIRLAYRNIHLMTIQALLSVNLIVIGCYGYFVVYPRFLQHKNLDVSFLLKVEDLFYILPFVVVYSLFIWWLVKHYKSPLYFWFKRLYHRQMIARTLFNEKLFITERRTRFGETFEKITQVPKVFYKAEMGFIYVRFPMDLQKWQSRFLQIGKDLEPALFADLFDTTQEEGYVVYKFLYAPILSRINVNDMKPSKQSIQLMGYVNWNFNSIPHALISGGTGAGKTYEILSLLFSFIRIGAEALVCDPKKSDLSYLGTIPALSERVFSDVVGIKNAVAIFVELMQERMAEFDKLANGRAGFNYYDFDLPPYVLVFDELSAFMGNLDYKEKDDVMKGLRQIILLGRQLGFFIIIGLQRPDGEYISTDLRDQFGLRIAMGKMSSMGYSMMFGETTKVFLPKDIKGFGYATVGPSNIQEFYSPFVPKGYDFVKEIGDFYAQKQGADVS